MEGSTANAPVGGTAGDVKDTNVKPGNVSPGGLRTPRVETNTGDDGDHTKKTPKEASEKPDGEGKEKPDAEAKPKAAEKLAVRKYKLPADDGSEEEVDEPEVRRRILHAREANKRMEEAASTQRRMQEFIEHLTTDPIGVLERLASKSALKSTRLRLWSSAWQVTINAS
jgi:hypothetical protein